jgi:hypothetical protein
MNREGSRNVPLDAPTGFIRKRWENHVFAADGIDRRFYELCVMAADLAFFLNKLDGHWVRLCNTPSMEKRSQVAVASSAE